jgi:hypothetical protein
VTPKRILFVSSVNNTPWGAAEELWSRAALDLSADGFTIFASYAAHSPPHPRVLDLVERGIEVWFRPTLLPAEKARVAGFDRARKDPHDAGS